MLRPLVFATALSLALLLGSSADASSSIGRAWPGGVIRYYDAAVDQAWAVDEAVDAWNASGANVHFIAVPASRAQLLITHYPNASCPGGPGLSEVGKATVGDVPNAVVFLYPRDDRSVRCNAYASALTAAHELGHVLGLGHETGACALMNPAGDLAGGYLCPRAPFWQWHCRLLEPDDVAGAIALYGGHARPLSGAGNCPLYRAIAEPAGLRVAYTPSPGHLQVTFHRPASAALPAFAPPGGSDSYALAYSPGRRCSASPASLPHFAWQVRAGAVQTAYVTYDTPGTACLQVWALDRLGRPGQRAAMLVTTHR